MQCSNHISCFLIDSEDFNRVKCRSTCDNCADRGNWELHDYSEQGRLVLQVVRKLSDLDLPDLTLVQLKGLVTNSKDKKIERHRAALEKCGGAMTLKHMSKGKLTVMTKDSCDTLLQVLLLQLLLCILIIRNYSSWTQITMSFSDNGFK